jgi:hypothetical protein
MVETIRRITFNQRRTNQVIISFDLLSDSNRFSSRQLTEKDEYINLLKENNTNVRKFISFV